MNNITKRVSITILGTLCAASLAAGVALLAKDNSLATYAESDVLTPSSTYYKDNLKDEKGNDYTLAKNFYDIIDGLNTSGDFKDGVVDKPLSFLDSDAIADWVLNGNLSIPKAFGAARDSYFYDHPELFYVDLYKLSISAMRTSGVYSARLDCGREADCYNDRGAYESVEAVNKDIADYEKELAAAVKYARDNTNEVLKNNTYGDAEDLLLAKYANEYLALHADYDYDALEYIDANNDYECAYTGNAYGALVVGKCVCRGYCFAYKAILDELELPCIIVSGYSTGKNTDGKSIKEGIAQGEAHSWNYVWLQNPATDKYDTETVALSDTNKDGSSWYAYDVTWNSNRKSIDVNSYINMNALTTGRNHVLNPIISSSNYELPFPELSLITYGTKTVDNDFVHKFEYASDGTVDDNGNEYRDYVEWIGYKGESALELAARDTDKLYILHHEAYYNSDYELVWTPWFAISEALKNAGDTAEDLEKHENKAEHLTKLVNYNAAVYSQFAVVSLAPDKPEAIAKYKMYYKDTTDLGEHLVFMSQIYTNKAFGTYTPPPYIKKTSPKHTEVTIIADYMLGNDNYMADKYAFDMKITYDEPLQILNPEKEIGVEFITGFKNIDDYAMVCSPVTISEDGYSLCFKFKPSLMYEHNSIFYSFYFDNVGSAKRIAKKNADGTVEFTTSKKAPNPAHFHFAREAVVCSQILGGGRLWVDCCAQPTLVSNSDLAAMDFKDPEGNSTFSEQARSQMMLVVDKAKEEEKTEILNSMDKDYGIKEEDIKSSETYDINLQICGKHPTIPDGSYVKIALGFPEGYGPKDEGVTFKIYHRKHVIKDGKDEYIIEDVPCVVTQFGIIATVTSFSPFMVVAVDASKASENKTVYATIDGKGGKLSKEDGQIRTVEPDGSYTYTFNPDEGYDVYKISLNGEDVTNKLSEENKLKVGYGDLLNNNEIVVQYIAKKAAQRYEATGSEVVNPVKVVVDTEGKESIATKAEDLAVNKPTTGTDPGTDPGTNSGTNPGTNPGTDPGTNPGTNPGTDDNNTADNNTGNIPGGNIGNGSDGETDHTTIAIILIGLGVAIFIALVITTVVLVRRRND